jgi:hypothetical protein
MYINEEKTPTKRARNSVANTNISSQKDSGRDLKISEMKKFNLETVNVNTLFKNYNKKLLSKSVESSEKLQESTNNNMTREREKVLKESIPTPTEVNKSSRTRSVITNNSNANINDNEPELNNKHTIPMKKKYINLISKQTSPTDNPGNSRNFSKFRIYKYANKSNKSNVSNDNSSLRDNTHSHNYNYNYEKEEQKSIDINNRDKEKSSKMSSSYINEENNNINNINNIPIPQISKKNYSNNLKKFDREVDKTINLNVINNKLMNGLKIINALGNSTANSAVKHNSISDLKKSVAGIINSSYKEMSLQHKNFKDKDNDHSVDKNIKLKPAKISNYYVPLSYKKSEHTSDDKLLEKSKVYSDLKGPFSLIKKINVNDNVKIKRNINIETKQDKDKTNPSYYKKRVSNFNQNF